MAQRIAVDHPERVLSVTLMSTSPAGTGGPELPPMSDALRARVQRRRAAARAGLVRPRGPVAYLLEGERPYSGSRGIDEPAMRALLGRVYDRSTSMASANHHFLVDGTDMARARLAEISVPALVIHGTDDPLFPPAHGEALAREIPERSCS